MGSNYGVIPTPLLRRVTNIKLYDNAYHGYMITSCSIALCSGSIQDLYAWGTLQQEIIQVDVILGLSSLAPESHKDAHHRPFIE